MSSGFLRRHRWLRLALILAAPFAVLIAGHVPYGTRIVVYRPVDSTERGEHLLRRSPRFTYAAAADHIIEDGRLFLCVQTTQAAFFSMYVRKFEWHEEEIASFRRTNPQLEHYWPRPESEDGGVWWVGYGTLW